jgi:type VI secretion system protein ImpG
MDREFVDLYNQELKLFYEHAAEFAQDYPAIADRLGGLKEGHSDPMFAALLQGAAFLAARVQLKMKDEFPEFTHNLIEQLLPGFLAPSPSAILARVKPVFGDPGLRDGRTFGRGAFLNAAYRTTDKNVSCRFTLTSDLTIWPFEIVQAEYHANPAPLQALGVEGDFEAGLRLTLRLRTAPRVEDEASDEEAREDPTSVFAGCPVTSLPIHLLGSEADAAGLYEQIFAHRTGVHLRYVDVDGEPRFLDTSDLRIEPVGFDDDERLLPDDPRLFSGFRLLQEYFLFPSKFLGFRLVTGRDKRRASTSLEKEKSELFPARARALDILITFREAAPKLAIAVTPEMFALYAAPAINLFPMTANQVRVVPSLHEYHVVPGSGRPLDFEPHRIVDVYALYSGHARRERLAPLYASAAADAAQAPPRYTIRRLPRRLTADERRFGLQSDYLGTEMFLSLTAPKVATDENRVQELSVQVLCSNRHLAGELPTDAGGADFILAEDTSLPVVCEIGPTLPKAPALLLSDEPGRVAWQLVNALSLNHVGLMRSDGQAVRDLLMLFADSADQAVSRAVGRAADRAADRPGNWSAKRAGNRTAKRAADRAAIERRIRALRNIEIADVVRRVKTRLGIGAARGMEVTVTFDETPFEGSGVFLMGAVLERFFAEYAAINHFTQTVLCSPQRGEIFRWAPRAGSRSRL